MNYEMIIENCKKAIRLNDALKFNYEYLENHPLEENDENISLLEIELLNVEKTIKSLTI